MSEKKNIFPAPSSKVLRGDYSRPFHQGETSRRERSIPQKPKDDFLNFGQDAFINYNYQALVKMDAFKDRLDQCEPSASR
jgi:hypothetical protein